MKEILYRQSIGPRNVFPKNKVTIEAGTCRTICPNTYRMDKNRQKASLKDGILDVLAVDRYKGRAHYPTTLFAQSESQTGRYTAQSTVY